MQSQTVLQRQALQKVLQSYMMGFGYMPIDIPIIQKADLFLTRAGDAIIERLFIFERLGQSLALRPEFTAAVAHHCVEDVPQRWQLSGTVFVDDPHDIQQPYERHHIGAELIGQAGVAADAEILAMALLGMDHVRADNANLVVGHVGLQAHLLGQYGLDARTCRLLLTQKERLRISGKEAVLHYLESVLGFDHDSEALTHTDPVPQSHDVLHTLLNSSGDHPTMGGRNHQDIAERFFRKYERRSNREQIERGLEFLQQWGQIQGASDDVFAQVRALIHKDDTVALALLDAWQQTIACVIAYGIPEPRIRLQPDLTRRWDYYTGLVFGIQINGNYVASGGRYDDLTQLLGRDALPAIGFAYYTEAILPHIAQLKHKRPRWTISGSDHRAVIRWAMHLRAAGYMIVIVDQDGDIEITDHDQVRYDGALYTSVELLRALES